MITNRQKIDEVLTRGVETVLPDKQGLLDLMTRQKITLYQGFDPSMPSLHLGNLVGIVKLAQFQKLGHKVIFLVGDFTGMIGDPTDKSATRKKLTRKQVLQNAKTWKEQAGKLLDFSGPNKAEFKFNSEWLDKVSFKDLIELTSTFTVQQLLERDMYQERLKKNAPIYLHEFLYPIAQGYDCVAMDVNLEIGGSDQIFNMLAGRALMKSLKDKEKYVLGTKLLVDKDGQKVGKTTGNALFLDSTPESFYGGIMSFPDEVIYLSYELLTDIDLTGLEDKISKNPLLEKKNLAFDLVKKLWGEKDAQKAQKSFENTFQKKDKLSYTDRLRISSKDNHTLLSTASKFTSSKTETKRLLSDNAIEVNQNVVNDPNLELKNGDIIKIGKKKIVKIILT